MNKDKYMRGIRIVESLLIIVFVIGMIIHIGPNNGVIGEVVENPTEEITIPSNITQVLENDVIFSQTFIPKYSYITEFSTIMLHTGDESTGYLNTIILDEKGNVILNKEIALEEIEPGAWHKFQVQRQVVEEKKYQLQLIVREASETPTIMLINSAFGLDENIECHYDNEYVPGSMLLNLSYRETKSILFRVIVCSLLAVAGAIVLCWINCKEAKKRFLSIVEEEGDIKKCVFWGTIVALSILILFVHCYKLTEIPYGINVDEMGSAYDAYCLANWGVDRFRISYPVYFINIGTGQNALYAYMLYVLFKIFGYSNKLLRIPAFINAILTVVFGSLIVNKQYRTRKSVILFVALYSILPIFTMSTRFGLESYLMLGFSTMFLYTFLQAVDKRKRLWFVISGICGGIVLYTYAISYLVMIVFLIMMLLYLIRTKHVSLKEIISFTIPLAIIGMPLVLCQIINMFDLPEIKIGLMTITKLQGYRGSEIEFDHIVVNFLESIKSIFMYDKIHYNSFPEYFTMYWVSIPFILVGICNTFVLTLKNIKERQWEVRSIIFSWFVCMIIIGCLLGGNGPNCNKLNGAFLPCLFFLVDGIFVIYGISKSEKWASLILGGSIVAYLVCFTTWSDYYFFRYVEDSYPEKYFEPLYTDALNILNGTGEQIANRTTYVDEYSAIYYCGSTLISPYEINYYTEQHNYKNYVFRYSGEKDTTANYILRDLRKDDAIELEKSGFIVQKVNSWFVCYNPNL